MAAALRRGLKCLGLTGQLCPSLSLSQNLPHPPVREVPAFPADGSTMWLVSSLTVIKPSFQHTVPGLLSVCLTHEWLNPKTGTQG